MERESFLVRFSHMVELPVALLALLIIPALLVEDRAQDARLRTAAIAINWLVWLAFCVDYVVKLAVAPSRRRFVRSAWFDLLIIILSPPFLVPQTLQSVRAVRAVRILRLLRFVRAAAVAAMGLRLAGDALRHRRFHYVALTTLVVVGLGAGGIFLVERGENRAIQSMGDALWWSIVTATTVGYGDVSPVTTEGRMIAVVLMIVGIGFLGMFTATLTSLFVEREQPPDSTVEQRLDRIEAKIDALIDETAQRRSIT